MDKFYLTEDNVLPLKYAYWRQNLEAAFLQLHRGETTENLSASEEAQILGEVTGMGRVGRMEEFKELFGEWAPQFDAF